MKKAVFILLFTVFALASVELLSSYFFYRYYAHSAKAFEPAGSAGLILFGRGLERLRGIKREVRLTIDHGPLFDRSETLGFTILPGSYRVTEHFNGKLHFFDLAVTSVGRRATSYFPVHASKRLIVLGDSAFFGWGVDDEETIPWLLQTRLPHYEVVNLSLTSYSTVHALLQLQTMEPKVGPDDIVVLAYHPVTNEFNVAIPGMLRQLTIGYESQLGNQAQLRSLDYPFGAIDSHGNFTIQRINLTCIDGAQIAGCNHPELPMVAAERVTQRAFDEIAALHAGRLIVAVVSASDTDPVVAHLKDIGVAVADLRTVNGYPEPLDVIPTDLHSGPFWHHQVYALLLKALQRENMLH